MADGIITLCNVACGSGVMTVNSPSGSTLQCGRWLWDDMPWNSPKRPPYWNSTSHFGFDHITKSTCHSAPVCEILSKSDHRQQKQEAQLSQRGRTMLRVCLYSQLQHTYSAVILPRDAMQARSLLSCSVCPSVRLSVRPLRSWIRSKRISISSKFFHHRVATPF